ncbi:TPA: conjugal transfer protein TraM [Legionella bozemanae]|uniref:conjugal transfer protein TraM n=1 Tax=Legionella bozemanae TaxID=447 RepID=UPI00399C9489
MSNKLDKIIQNITVKHGVLLGKDDPILMLQTMNEQLIEENRKAQQSLLIQFREEMEGISSQWKNDAKEKSEKILNAALTSSKEAIARLMQDSSNESIQTMKIMMSASLAEARDMAQQVRKLTWFALLSSTVILIGSCLIILFFSSIF